MLGFVGTVFGIIAGLALVPIYAFYFLLEKQGINDNWRDYLPVHDSKFRTKRYLSSTPSTVISSRSFAAKVLVAIADGVLYTIGFVIIGLPYALLLGVMATALTIIPFSAPSRPASRRWSSPWFRSATGSIPRWCWASCRGARRWKDCHPTQDHG